MPNFEDRVRIERYIFDHEDEWWREAFLLAWNSEKFDSRDSEATAVQTRTDKADRAVEALKSRYRTQGGRFSSTSADTRRRMELLRQGKDPDEKIGTPDL